MSISEQVKELRELAECYYSEIRHHASTITNAADTIEALSAKLQAANGELERWHKDHINEKIKNPFANTSTLICSNCDHKDEYIEELEAEAEELKEPNMERSAEDCGGWVPCSERMPEENQNVIACFAHGTVTELRFYDKKFHGIYEYDEKVIVAWMPLPKAYGELHEP